MSTVFSIRDKITKYSFFFKLHCTSRRPQYMELKGKLERKGVSKEPVHNTSVKAFDEFKGSIFICFLLFL